MEKYYLIIADDRYYDGGTRRVEKMVRTEERAKELVEAAEKIMRSHGRYPSSDVHEGIRKELRDISLTGIGDIHALGYEYEEIVLED